MDRREDMNPEVENNTAQWTGNGGDQQENRPGEDTGGEAHDNESGKDGQENVGSIPECIAVEFQTNYDAGNEIDDRMSLYDNAVFPPDLNQRVEPIYSEFILHKDEVNDVATFRDPNPGDYFSIDEISQLINGYDDINPYAMPNDSISDNQANFVDETSEEVRFLLDGYSGQRCSPVESDENSGHFTEAQILTKENIVAAVEKAEATVNLALKNIYQELYNNIQYLGINGVQGPTVAGTEDKFYLEVNEEVLEGCKGEEDMESVDFLTDAFQNWSTDVNGNGRKYSKQTNSNPAENENVLQGGQGSHKDLQEKYFHNVYGNYTQQQQIIETGTAAVAGTEEKYYLEVNEEGFGDRVGEDIVSVDIEAAFQNYFTDVDGNGIKEQVPEQNNSNPVENSETVFPGGEGASHQDLESYFQNVYWNYTQQQQIVEAGTASSYIHAQSTDANGTYTSQFEESASVNRNSEQQKIFEDDPKDVESADDLNGVKHEESGDDPKGGKHEESEDDPKGGKYEESGDDPNEHEKMKELKEKFEKSHKSRPGRCNRSGFQKYANWPHGMKLPKILFNHLIGTAELQLKSKWGDVQCWEKLYKPLIARKRLMVACKKMQIINREDILTELDKPKFKRDVHAGSTMRRSSLSKFSSDCSSSLSTLTEEEDKLCELPVHQKTVPSDATYKEPRTPKEDHAMQDDYLPTIIRGADNNFKIMHRCVENSVRDAIMEELLANLDDKRPK